MNYVHFSVTSSYRINVKSLHSVKIKMIQKFKNSTCGIFITIVLMSGALGFLFWWFSIAQFQNPNEISTKNQEVIYKFKENEEKIKENEFKFSTGFGRLFEFNAKVPATDIETIQDRQRSHSAEDFKTISVLSVERVLKQSSEVEFIFEIFINKSLDNTRKITEDFKLDLADEIEDFFDVNLDEFVNIVIEKIEEINKNSIKISMSLENDQENLDLKNIFEKNQKLVELVSRRLSDRI